jgi:hypothetical protein
MEMNRICGKNSQAIDGRRLARQVVTLGGATGVRDSVALLPEKADDEGRISTARNCRIR